jgi:hypothetical protein
MKWSNSVIPFFKFPVFDITVCWYCVLLRFLSERGCSGRMVYVVLFCCLAYCGAAVTYAVMVVNTWQAGDVHSTLGCVMYM